MRRLAWLMHSAVAPAKRRTSACTTWRACTDDLVRVACHSCRCCGLRIACSLLHAVCFTHVARCMLRLSDWRLHGTEMLRCSDACAPRTKRHERNVAAGDALHIPPGLRPTRLNVERKARKQSKVHDEERLHSQTTVKTSGAASARLGSARP